MPDPQAPPISAIQGAFIDSWVSISDKTIFILDRSPYFTHVSSGHSIQGDFSSREKRTNQSNEIQINPFERSMWSCAVEAVVGYSRLVWDLYTPNRKSIEILASSPNGDKNVIDKASEPCIIEKICSWSEDEQNLDHLLKSLAKRSCSYEIAPLKLHKTTDISSYPNCSSDSAPTLSAIDHALTDLAQLTKSQLEQRSHKRSSHQCLNNNGRVILISSFQNEDSLKRIIDKFQEKLQHKNASMDKAEQNNPSQAHKYSQVNFCDLVIINTFPIIDEGPTSKINVKFESSEDSDEFRPKLHIRTFSVKSGRFISGLLNNLCLEHYNLKSTTITGIPMKEEQNASSSSQYDVEIVHCASIHSALLDLNPNFLAGVTATIDRNGFPCQTYKLSWCTPRNSCVEMNQCIATSRITAVDVNSRPSACLTNFLLNGKQVMLEIYKSKSNRMTTHMLSSHNGELFIHSFETIRHRHSIGESPLLCESLGGKVSDYRMNDFIQLMKQHTLVEIDYMEEPLSKTLNLISRQTLYWPIALSHTIMMNVPHLLSGLISRIQKGSMSQIESEECKRVVDNLVACEKEGHALPSITMIDVLKSSGTSKSNNPKLDQLYRLLWNELEYYLRVHSTTPEHEAVLEHLLERNGDKYSNRGTKRPTTTKSLAIQANPKKKQKIHIKLIPEINDSPPSESLMQTAIFYKTGMTLYQTWAHLYQLYHRSRSKLPFIGRLQPTALYSSQQGNTDKLTVNQKTGTSIDSTDF